MQPRLASFVLGFGLKKKFKKIPLLIATISFIFGEKYLQLSGKVASNWLKVFGV